MTVNKRKKNSRQLGSKTFGWGAMKKHRGAGNRGGRGRAGSGAKGDCKKPSYRQEQKGKHGFNSPLINPNVNTINLSLITQRLPKMVEAGTAVKGKNGFELDLSKLKIDKLLGSGNITEKLVITVGQASAKAIEKIEALGGSVTVLEGGDDDFEDSPVDEESDAKVEEVVEEASSSKTGVVEKPKAKPKAKAKPVAEKKPAAKPVKAKKEE